MQYHPGEAPKHQLPDVKINPDALVKCIVNIFPNTPEIALAVVQNERAARIAAAIYQAESALSLFGPDQIRPTVHKYGKRLLTELCKELLDELKAQGAVSKY